MVNDGFIDAGQAGAERRMILSYAPAHARAGLAALLALDDALGAMLRSTREPMVGQMRLTWWHEALSALDTQVPPAEPVLQALAQDVVPRLKGAVLAEMVEGWEELLDPGPLDHDRLAAFADRRGGGLFVAAGVLLGAVPADPLAVAGRGWALADLAAHIIDARARVEAEALAKVAFAEATARRWSRSARALGAMAHLAAMADAPPPTRVARALWHRLTGR